mmetsp:Transcript_37080/g.109335  ORF Transcript_37080/g.109335 Transcript_37080/m.109335 type:complete len:339 (-) Transcript_37080:1041-2057(-)
MSAAALRTAAENGGIAAPKSGGGCPVVVAALPDLSSLALAQQQQQQQQQQELQGQEELQGQQELKGHQQFSEALVRLPHSYFANAYRALYANTPASPEDFDNPAPGGLPIGSGDTATGTAADAMRLSLGLPCRPAVVYCCCNQLYKLDPATLGVWCRVLARVPGSVLWLLRFPADAERRVRDAAEAAGAPPAALVFTDVDRKAAHLSRLSLAADVFLDTPACNAHTGAVDALWSGVPLLTLPGRKMAQRVAASVAAATGLGRHMVVWSLQEYEDRAVALGVDVSLRTSLRARLSDVRHTCALFDAPRWVRGLEAGIEAAWTRYVSGQLPTDIDVPDVP